MRATLRLSPSETRTRPLNFFLTFLDLEVRMWRFLVWPRRIVPVPVFLKRLAAPLWVFNLGMVFLLTSRVNNCGDYTGVRAVTPVPRVLLEGRAHCRSLRYAQDDKEE